MKKNKKLLVGLLTIVILAVIGLSAYAYQKQQTLNSNKPKVEKKKDDSKFEKLIKDTVSKFNKENDLNKKIEIFKSLVDKKDEISKEKKDKLNSDYNDAIKNMREKLSNSIKDKIKNTTLSDDDKKNNEKVEAAKKELNDLQALLDKEKSVIFEKNEDYDAVVQSIKDALTALEAPKSTESNQQPQQQEAQSQATAETAGAPAPQQPANTNTPSYSNSNTYSYSSNSSTSTERRRPSTPSNNTVVNETPSNTGATTIPETPSTPPTSTPGSADSNANANS